jgi:mono/diheme cytochrome c family protein
MKTRRQAIAAARRTCHMRRNALIAALLSGFVVCVTAAAAEGDAAGDQVKLGERLVNQSCVVCHFAPQITSGSYAPALSKDTLRGNAEIMHQFIADGSPRMPGFKYQFNPQQIDAIVAYIKTIPPAPAAPAPRKARSDGGAD